MIRFKKFITEEVAFKRDNPGGEWLERHQEQAEKDMKSGRSDSYVGKGLGGKVTGYFTKTLELPTKHLKNIPGAQGEEHYRNDTSSHKNKELDASVKKSGFNTKDSPILIGVNHKGKPHVLEGNHRLAHAARNGHEKIHAEVRYWNGGESVLGQGFHPDAVLHMHNHGDYKGIKS